MIDDLRLVLLIIVIVAVGSGAKEFTSQRPELWLMLAETLAIVGFSAVVGWYQHRPGRFYIVVRAGGH